MFYIIHIVLLLYLLHTAHKMYNEMHLQLQSYAIPLSFI